MCYIIGHRFLVVGENTLGYFWWFVLLFTVSCLYKRHTRASMHIHMYVCTYVLYVYISTMISCFYTCSHDVHVCMCRVVSL